MNENENKSNLNENGDINTNIQEINTTTTTENTSNNNSTKVAESNETATDVEDKTKKKKRISIISILIIIAIIIIAIVSIVIINLTKPENIIKSNISLLFEQLTLENSTSTEFLNNLLSDAKYIDSNLTINTNFEQLDSLSLKLVGNLDLSNKYAFMRFILSNNDYTIFNGLTKIDENSTYINDYIITDNEYIAYDNSSDIFNVSPSEDYSTYYNNTLKIIENVILSNITEDIITSEDEVVTIENKTINTNKISINLSSANIQKITNELITEFKSSEDFYNLLYIIYGYSKEEIDQLLTDLSTNLNTNSSTDDTVFQINFYTNLFKVIKIDINTSTELNNILSIINYSTDTYDYQLQYLFDDYTTYTANIKSDKTNNYIIDLYSNEEFLFTINYNLNNDTTTLNLTNDSFSLGLSNKQSVTSTEMELNLNLSDLFIIDLTYNISTTDENLTFTPDNVKIENAKNYTELTEEELNILTTNYNNILNEAPFMELMNSLLTNFLFNSSDSNYEDYDSLLNIE